MLMLTFFAWLAGCTCTTILWATTYFAIEPTFTIVLIVV
jgi:hypothetical protein